MPLYVPDYYFMLLKRRKSLQPLRNGCGRRTNASRLLSPCAPASYPSHDEQATEEAAPEEAADTPEGEDGGTDAAKPDTEVAAEDGDAATAAAGAGEESTKEDGKEE